MGHAKIDLTLFNNSTQPSLVAKQLANSTIEHYEKLERLNTKRVNVYLPSGVADSLMTIAIASGMAVSGILSVAVMKHLSPSSDTPLTVYSLKGYTDMRNISWYTDNDSYAHIKMLAIKTSSPVRDIIGAAVIGEYAEIIKSQGFSYESLPHKEIQR